MNESQYKGGYANPEDLKNYGTGQFFDSDVLRVLNEYRAVIIALDTAIKNEQKILDDIDIYSNRELKQLGNYLSGHGIMPALLMQKRYEAYQARRNILTELQNRISSLENKRHTAYSHLDKLERARAREIAENKKVELSEIGF